MQYGLSVFLVDFHLPEKLLKLHHGYSKGGSPSFLISHQQILSPRIHWMTKHPLAKAIWHSVFKAFILTTPTLKIESSRARAKTQTQVDSV